MYDYGLWARNKIPWGPPPACSSAGNHLLGGGAGRVASWGTSRGALAETSLSLCFRAGLQGMKLDLTLKEEPRDHGYFAHWICPFGTRTNRCLSFSVIQGFIRREVTSGLTRLSPLPYKCSQPDSFSTPPTSQREMLENEPRISRSSQENHRRCCCGLESLCHWGETFCSIH